jgi:hypothetical protein
MESIPASDPTIGASRLQVLGAVRDPIRDTLVAQLRGAAAISGAAFLFDESKRYELS